MALSRGGLVCDKMGLKTFTEKSEQGFDRDRKSRYYSG